MTFIVRKLYFIKSPYFHMVLLCFLITTVLINLAFSRAYASETGGEYPHIYDKAGLLSTDEVKELDELCIKDGDEAGIEIMILTHNDPDAEYAETYIEDFEDSLPKADRVILLIDMANRKSYIEGYGLAATYIHSHRIDEIIDAIRSPLSNGDYLTAFKKYIELSANCMTDDSYIDTEHNYSSNDTDNLLSAWWFQLIASLAVGTVTVGIMVYNFGGRITAGGDTYMDDSHSGLIGRKDNYIRTRITKIRKPKDSNSSGGGFRGGISSSGRSHSSGGGSF
jgi:uncharacterized protein